MYFPVIMCGGGGSRLWPTSTARRPKQFLPLVGDRSIFQSTALRVAGLEDVAELVIVAGEAHADLIETQLAAIGLRGVLILEPEARDSGPAIAAAAAWIHQRDPHGVAVVVASDHHLPDVKAFRDDVRTASALAREGRIVTFGVAPRGPSTAYGYIMPGAPRAGGFDVEAFVEKPCAEDAERYVTAGYLWNSGNFVGTAATLMHELDAHAPSLATAVRAAVAEAGQASDRIRLGPAFRSAPKIAFDRAVMETTDRAAVLPVLWEWSDLGAWSAIHAVMPDQGNGDGNRVVGDAIAIESEHCVVRTDGPLVALVGVRDLAVIAENGAVLVCHLDADQSVKSVSAHPLARIHASSRSSDGPESAMRVFEDLDRWLRTSALPLWSTLGADHDGWGFHETLTLDGRPGDAPRRARVQARQAYVFARAGRLGWLGPWRSAATQALDALERHYRRSDGLYRRLVDSSGATLDDTAELYDQAFALLAMAEVAKASADVDALARRAAALRDSIDIFRWRGGGFREAGARPFQSNCHMHLFEACQAWMGVRGADPAPWRRLAEEIVDLATTRFITRSNGALHEFFDEDWNLSGVGDQAWIEPGHQFEWAWLLDQWRAVGGDVDASIVRALYAAGRAGRDDRRGVFVNRITETFQTLDATARLWPQTEALRAAGMMWKAEADPTYAADVNYAGRAVARYLDTATPGLWRDAMTSEGDFVSQPAPGSSLYHLVCFLEE